MAEVVVDRLARHANTKQGWLARVERSLVHVVVLAVVAEEWRLIVRSVAGIVREVRGI